MSKKKICSMCHCSSRECEVIYYGFQRRFYVNVCSVCRTRMKFLGKKMSIPSNFPNLAFDVFYTGLSHLVLYPYSFNKGLCKIPCSACLNFDTCHDEYFNSRCRSCIHDGEDYMVSVCRDCVGFGRVYDVRKDYYEALEK